MIERNIKLKQIKNIYKHSTPTPTRSFTTMALDLSANGPLFFTINGFNFEKWNDPNNNFAVLYLQEHRIGLVSDDKIYFDINKLHLLGDMTLWPDTLNNAISDDNQNYDYQRNDLQQILHNMRMATDNAILAAIDDIVNESLTAYDDFDL